MVVVVVDVDVVVVVDVVNGTVVSTIVALVEGTNVVDVLVWWGKINVDDVVGFSVLLVTFTIVSVVLLAEINLRHVNIIPSNVTENERKMILLWLQ